jgi:hypothetical protein
MIEINAAWRLLGNAERRATHDAGRAVATSRGTTPDRPDVGAGLPARPPRDARASSSIVDFGRYAGLTISQLVDQDQDYAVWLARTPIGRRLAPEIDAALVRRDAQLAELVPKPPDTRPAFLRRRVVEAR